MNAARLAQEAEDHGLYWDPSLTPPRLPGGPNDPGTPGDQPHPANASYVSVAAGIGPAHGHYHCDDRRFQHVLPFGTPADNFWHCAHSGGAVYPPGVAPLLPGEHWRRMCFRADLNLHPAAWGYRICRMCSDQTREQAWYKRMERDLTGRSVGRFLGARLNQATLPRLMRLPWDPLSRIFAVDQPIESWRRFLTHLCRECEKEERIKLHFAHPAGIGGPAVGAPTDSFKMLSAQNQQAWPWVACICRFELFRGELGDRDYCIRHRYIKAGRRHNILLHTRQQNDQWLRETTLKGGRIVRASHQKVTQRTTMKIFRACRCGRDIVPDGQRQRVAMCLGCEGVVSSSKRNIARMS
jgi:hypothetical protein